MKKEDDDDEAEKEEEEEVKRTDKREMHLSISEKATERKLLQN